MEAVRGVEDGKHGYKVWFGCIVVFTSDMDASYKCLFENVETATTVETQFWLFQLQCTFHPSKGSPQEGFGAFAGVQEELKSFVVDVAQALSEVCFSVSPISCSSFYHPVSVNLQRPMMVFNHPDHLEVYSFLPDHLVSVDTRNKGGLCFLNRKYWRCSFTSCIKLVSPVDSVKKHLLCNMQNLQQTLNQQQEVNVKQLKMEPTDFMPGWNHDLRKDQQSKLTSGALSWKQCGIWLFWRLCCNPVTTKEFQLVL